MSNVARFQIYANSGSVHLIERSAVRADEVDLCGLDQRVFGCRHRLVRAKALDSVDPQHESLLEVYLRAINGARVSKAELGCRSDASRRSG